ncbi:MAG: hypothetical protein ABJA57_13210 [Ginsengibacter sp.]
MSNLTTRCTDPALSKPWYGGWTSTFKILLTLFLLVLLGSTTTTFGQAQTEKLTIPGILERREHLEVNFILTYDTKGSEFQLQSGVFTASANDTIQISI